MSHAEARPHLAAGRRSHRRRWSTSSARCASTRCREEVRHYARRHLLDTVGVMIAGAGGTVATCAETVLASVRARGHVPVPGRARRADLLDAAFLGGTAAHGIELDDGYRQGSVHPRLHGDAGRARASATIARASGRALIEAIVAGYETTIADRARLPSGSAPARISSDRRGAACSVRTAPSPSCAACRPHNSPMRSASPPSSGRAVRLRQRRRRHQAAARRPRRARRLAGGAAGASRALKARRK